MTIGEPRATTTDEDNQRDAALANLLCNSASKLTHPTQINDTEDDLAADFTKGWYALRIHSDSNYPEYASNFLYTLDSENWANGRPHPMSQGKDYMKHPLNDDATYYVRLWKVTGADSKTY